MNRCLVISLLSLLCFGVLSSAIAEAQADRPELRVRAWIQPAQELVPSQQIQLNIEVSTTTWFSGATQIGNLEVDDLVVLRRDGFAVNSIRRIGGQTWTVQTWSIMLYPQRAGDFKIPSIELQVPVASGNGDTLRVARRTRPLSFDVTTPAAIESSPLLGSANTSWLATDRFSVRETFQGEFNSLRTGDAITRVIEVSADNMAAMMLPPINVTAPSGIGVYADVASLEDKVNRGSYLAKREQKITYIVEQPGEYSLPKIDYYWWDLSAQRLRVETLPERSFTTTDWEPEVVGEAPLVAQSGAAESNGALISRLAIIVAVCLLTLIAVVLVTRRLMTIAGSAGAQRKRIQRQYKNACRAKDYARAATLFFDWWRFAALQFESGHEQASVRKFLQSISAQQSLILFDRLMCLAHAATLDSVPSKKNQLALRDLLSRLESELAVASQSSQREPYTAFQLN